MLSIQLHHLSLIVSLLETERIRNKSDDIVIINVRKTIDTLFGITTEESDTELCCTEKNVAQQSNFSTMKKQKGCQSIQHVRKQDST